MHCLACLDPIDTEPGNIFYELRAGQVYLGPNGVQFEEEQFEDGESFKWLCVPCAAQRQIDSCCPDEEYCVVCNRAIELDDEDGNYDMMVRITEVRLRNSRMGIPTPDYLDSGHVHFLCAAEDWDLPLWNWLLERDTMPCP